MGDDEKHAIRNLIVFPVIVGLILTALLYFIPRLLAFVLHTLNSVWIYIVSRTYVPNSILWLLVILSVPTVIIITRHFIRNTKHITSDEPSIKSYNMDKNLGMIWKWKFIRDDNFPSSDIWCFCPNCSNRLVYSYDIDVHMNHSTTFTCENCHFISGTFQGYRDDVIDRVKRAVERKVTTGEWKEVVKGLSSSQTTTP